MKAFADRNPQTAIRYRLEKNSAQVGKAAVVKDRRSATTGADGINRIGRFTIMVGIFSLTLS